MGDPDRRREPAGLLLDYGGVLTGDVIASFKAFCRREDLEWEAFKETVLRAAREPDSPFVRVEVGAIEQDEFDRQLAGIISRAAGRPLEPEGLKQRLFAESGLDRRMIDAVAAARDRGVRTALVSNSWGGADYPRPLLERLFEAILISGEVGVRKPEPAIYRMAAEAVGLPPERCLFVDDFQVNVEGAEAVGMQAIHHRSADATILALETFLGFPLEAAAAPE